MNFGFAAAAADLGRQPSGQSCEAYFTQLANAALDCGGALTWALRLVHLHGIRRRPAGESSDAIFPLPLVGFRPLPRRGRLRGRAKERLKLKGALNAIILSLNFLFAGSREAAVPS